MFLVVVLCSLEASVSDLCFHLRHLTSMRLLLSERRRLTPKTRSHWPSHQAERA